MAKLLVNPNDVKGAEKMRLVTDGNGNLARQLIVALDTFPDGAVREDAFACGWLDISPYWEEPYDLIVNNSGVLEYRAK